MLKKYLKNCTNYVTLVIESVRQFVAHDDADAAEVQAIGILHVVERALKNSGGEDDLILGRRIISVHGRWRHYPGALIHHLIEFLEVLL